MKKYEVDLKLAETETFFNRFGEYPVLILDDVLSELDKKRLFASLDIAEQGGNKKV